VVGTTIACATRGVTLDRSADIEPFIDGGTQSFQNGGSDRYRALAAPARDFRAACSLTPPDDALHGETSLEAKDLRTYASFQPRDYKIWKAGADRFGADGKRIFHDAKAFNSGSMGSSALPLIEFSMHQSIGSHKSARSLHLRAAQGRAAQLRQALEPAPKRIASNRPSAPTAPRPFKIIRLSKEPRQIWLGPGNSAI
jgi:hypothetical protein